MDPIYTRVLIILVIIIAFALIVAAAKAGLIQTHIGMGRDYYHRFGGRDRARLKDLAAHPRTKSEQRCIDVLEKTTGQAFPSSYPEWLKWQPSRVLSKSWRGRDAATRPMELDGYCAPLRIALEFQGPLHTRHYPERESYRDYFERICKDAEKIRQCRAADVDLIVVDMRTPPRHLDTYIRSRLYDISARRTTPVLDANGNPIERPWNWMPPETGEVYRNHPLEREIGLSCSALDAATVPSRGDDSHLRHGSGDNSFFDGGGLCQRADFGDGI